MTVLDKIKDAGKAFAGAFAGAVIAVLQGSVAAPDGTVVQLPHTAGEWGAFTASVAIGFVLPYVVRNFPSVAKAQANLELAQQRVETGKQSQ